MRKVLSPVNRTFREVFGEARTHSYTTFVPSFYDSYSWTVGRTSDNVGADIVNISAEELDKKIEERITGGGSVLQFYDGITHVGIFNLPKYIRKFIAEETLVITEDSPAYIYS